MSLQLPPFWPRSEQVKSMRGPTIAVTFDLVGVNKQLRVESRHEQAASLGVGGSVVDASQVLFVVGQLG